MAQSFFCDLRVAGDEEPVDGVALRRHDFGHQADGNGEDSRAFFENGLKVGKGSCLGVAGGRGGGDGGIDFSLQGGVYVRVGDDVEHGCS